MLFTPLVLELLQLSQVSWDFNFSVISAAMSLRALEDTVSIGLRYFHMLLYLQPTTSMEVKR